MICILQIWPLSFAIFKLNDNKRLKIRWHLVKFQTTRRMQIRSGRFHDCSQTCRSPAVTNTCKRASKGLSPTQSLTGYLQGDSHWKAPTPIFLLSTECGGKKCSQRKFSQPPSVSGTIPATRTVGGAYRKVISFSSHCRHTGGDRAGERQPSGREGELCGCRQNEREKEREGQTERKARIDPLCPSVCLSVS